MCRFTVRVSRIVLDQLMSLAEKERRTPQEQAAFIIEQVLAKESEKKTEAAACSK